MKSVIVTNKYCDYQNYTDKGYKAFFTSMINAMQSNEGRNSVRNAFKEYCSSYSFLMNVYYSRIALPLISLLEEIDSVVENNEISEIHLFDGYEYPFFALRFGEGENKKQDYKSSYLFNAVIKQIYKSRCKIVWNNYKKSRYKNRFRNLKIYLINIASMFLNSIKKKKEKIGKTLNYGILCVSDLKLEVDNIDKILSLVPDLQGEYCHVVPDNMDVLNKPNYIHLQKIGIGTSFKVLWKSLKSLGFKYPAFNIKELKIDFDVCSVKFALATEILNFETRVNSICNTVSLLKNKPKFLVTSMTYGMDIISCHTAARINDMKHINLQGVSMSSMKFPYYDLADEYYMYSFKAYELYKKENSSYKYYLPLLDNAEVSNNEKLVEVIFCQPEAYEGKYLRLIDELSKMIENDYIDCELIIKPHYRQKKEVFIKYEEKYPFIKISNSDVLASALIKEASLVISITSSVLFESVMNGKFAIVANINNEEDRIIRLNDVCFESVNIEANTVQDIHNIIKNFRFYEKVYIERYNKFISSFPEGINSFKDVFKYE
jgi:hypothetical protein